MPKTTNELIELIAKEIHNDRVGWLNGEIET